MAQTVRGYYQAKATKEVIVVTLVPIALVHDSSIIIVFWFITPPNTNVCMKQFCFNKRKYPYNA